MLAMKIETGDLEAKMKQLAQMPDLIRKAVVGAMSDTVDDVHTRQTMEMKAVFDRPTNYVLKGLIKNYPGGVAGKRGRFARYGSGVMEAGTEFEFFPVGKSPEDIVRPHVFGGSRGQKRSERRLRTEAGILPAGAFTIMGNNYPRDGHGNISGARYAEMLAALGAMSETARSNLPKGKQKDRKKVRFYVMKRGKTPIGIRERNGSNSVVMLVFARSVSYRKNVKFDYFDVGRKQVAYSLPLHFNRIVNRYMSRM